MSDDAPPPDGLSALRTAARGLEERYLVGLGSQAERKRVVAALAAEGLTIEAPSTREALRRLADEPFDISLLDCDERVPGLDAIAQTRELRPYADLVVVMRADPSGCGEAFGREAAAVMPRPLPETDALLRAHLKWLASCRRSRARGRLVTSAFATHRAEIENAQPALAEALGALASNGQDLPSVAILGDAALAHAAGAGDSAAAPDVIVVALAAADDVEARMHEARSRASGAAIVVADAGATDARLRAALYGGARAYLPRERADLLGRIVASAAARRHAEVMGRKMVEALARFAVLDESDRGRISGPRDVDARLIQDATLPATGAMVPSGHEVLVVDDEAVVLTVLREALRRGGYRVTTAASAEEAIDLMRARRFDLVLTDKNLPGASGLDVLREAKKLDPAPAIVLITGYSSYDSAVLALDIGAHDYIEKPIRDVDDLRFRIRRALSRRDEQMARGRPSSPNGAARVLLVEEEGDRRRLIADFLSQSYTVTAVANGDEALARLEETRFDVVLADRNLPGVSGLRVIEQARRLLPHCASVLYTAYPSYETVKEAFAAGVDAFIVRPSDDLKKLREKISEALAGRGGILLG